MGGYGSGRPVERATIGRCWSYSLTMGNFRELILWNGAAEVRMTFNVNGDRMALEAGFHAAAPSPSLELRHPSRCEPRQAQVYRVRLTGTPMRFGGVRWWFLCPLSGRRVAKLYLPGSCLVGFRGGGDIGRCRRLRGFPLMLDGAHDRHAPGEPLRPDRRREMLCAGPPASLAGRGPLPSCGSAAVARHGRDDTQPHRQRYRCTLCGSRFDDLTGTVLAGHHQPLRVWMLCLYRMGLNLSNRPIAQELGLGVSDVQAMTEHLRAGLVAKMPAVVLDGTVEVDEVYVVAGHEGHPAAVAKKAAAGGDGGSRAHPVAVRWRKKSRRSSA